MHVYICSVCLYSFSFAFAKFIHCGQFSKLSNSDLQTLGKRREHLLPGEAGRARFVLHIELFLSLLAFKGEFSGVVDNLVQENFSGDKPPDPQLTKVLPRDQTLFFWERA